MAISAACDKINRRRIVFFCKETEEFMGNFRFKQFEIEQDRCAMKVGTDGVFAGCMGARWQADSGHRFRNGTDFAHDGAAFS